MLFLIAFGFAGGFLMMWILLSGRSDKPWTMLLRRLKVAFHHWRNQGLLEQQWPLVLQMLSGLLKTGVTLDEALNILAYEMPEPLKSHVLDRSDFIEKMTVQEKIQCLFPYVNQANIRSVLLMCHESGAKITSFLERCAAVSRKKKEMKDKLSALTAQTRSSAWIVGLSPFFIMASFHFVSPSYFEPMFKTRSGVLLLILALFMIGIGLLFTHRSARLEP